MSGDTTLAPLHPPCPNCTKDLVCWGCVAIIASRAHAAGLDQGLDLASEQVGPPQGRAPDVAVVVGDLVSKIERRNGCAVLTMEGGAVAWLDEQSVRLANLALGIAGGIAGQWAKPPRSCRACGCTEDRGCVVVGRPGRRGCRWVEADLCSACAGLERRVSPINPRPG